MENTEIDISKEKNTAKSMLKLVEESLIKQQSDKERKVTKNNGRFVSPSNNWNMLRKKIQQAKIPKPKTEEEIKNKKKNKKRKLKEGLKVIAESEKTVKGNSVVEQVFFPEKYDKSKGITPIVALDWEMVEVDHTSEGLARVSIVNYNGHVLLDTFVRPKGTITNYRSWVSGVYPSSMKKAMPYSEARDKALEILKDRIIVGHSLKHDFKVLNWEPLEHNVRDLITFKKFQDVGRQPKSLKKLTLEFLEKSIQTGEHSSVVDARAALGCYRVVENSWNQQARSKQLKLKRTRIEAETIVHKTPKPKVQKVEEKALISV